MLLKRREFIKTASLATASLWLPRFLHGMQRPGALANNGRVLIMLQLSGGNDGLNTVIPVRNDIYYRERPRIGIQPDKALRLTDEAALHPALTGFKTLFDAGELGILHNVGYPNPDRSHFRSMDIWQSGSPANEYWTTGWLGRYLDAQCAGRPTAALEIDDTLSLAMKGLEIKGLALQDARRLYETAHSAYFTDYAAAHRGPSDSPSGQLHDEDTPVGYLYKTMSDTIASADYLYEKSRAKPASGSYPTTNLGKQFATIASLILADTDTSVFYVSHGSFDTHINQQNQQQRLFQEMSDALAAFSGDMKANGRWQDVLVVTFSEFGRRVSQNASGGTDHGTANQMFFLGGRLGQKGLINELPNLQDLDQGDLKFGIDFRNVYADILQNWLKADAEKVLGEYFKPIGIVGH